MCSPVKENFPPKRAENPLSTNFRYQTSIADVWLSELRFILSPSNIQEYMCTVLYVKR